MFLRLDRIGGTGDPRHICDDGGGLILARAARSPRRLTIGMGAAVIGSEAAVARPRPLGGRGLGTLQIADDGVGGIEYVVDVHPVDAHSPLDGLSEVPLP